MPNGRMSGPTDTHYYEAALRNPALIATLPFDQDRVARYITDRVLYHTRQRWSWFSEAQKLHPALGTLSYLPPEVRAMIYRALVHCRENLGADGLWEYDETLGYPLDMSSYYFGFGLRSPSDNSVKGIRLASSVTKLEFEETFLSSHTFRFNSAESLASFFDRLQDTMKARVLSIDIGLCPLYIMDPWMSPITHLPQGLLRIRFRLYPVTNIFTVEDKIQRFFEYFERLVERAVKSAPHAQVSICSTAPAPLQPRFQVAADAIMGRLRNQIQI